jgi:hypothetical protein
MKIRRQTNVWRKRRRSKKRRIFVKWTWRKKDIEGSSCKGRGGSGRKFDQAEGKETLFN